MKFDQLQYFVAAARRQHIGQAARFLNISPSAISHSIAALEMELGRTLFEKKGRRIRLTQHGAALLERAELLLQEAERIRDELSSEHLEMRGHYRIAATHTLCGEFLTPAWMQIQKEHPGLTATLHSLRSGDVLARAIAGEIDLGFCFSPHSGPHHEQTILHEGQLLLSFGRRHPFLRERRIEELSKYPSIAALAAQGIENCENHPSFQKFRIQSKIANLFDSYDVAIQALKAQSTWTLLPDFLAYSHRRDIETYIPRGWDAEYVITAVWPKHRIRTPGLDQVIEGVRGRIRAASSR